jgi:hypothetical protein
MSRSVIAALVFGLVALGLIVTSAYVPWFWWLWLDGTETWPDDTDVWGPPAYVAGLPYATVDVSPPHRRIVDVAVGVYLGLYLLGLVLWARLIWALSRASRRRWRVLAAGGAGIVVSAGLVVVFGLAEYIAQKVGLYAAIASSYIVVAQWAGVRVLGPLLLGAGTALMVGVVARQ